MEQNYKSLVELPDKELISFLNSSTLKLINFSTLIGIDEFFLNFSTFKLFNSSTLLGDIC